LIRAGRAAWEWMNRPQLTESLSPDGMFLAACLWKQGNFDRAIALPFWSAPEQSHHRLAVKIGLEWLVGFLDCVADATKAGRDELARLHQAEEKARSLPGTARSKLPAAIEATLRAPVITARDLAKTLKVTPQAALGLLRQLLDAGIIREATGRASWRAFVLA
jgi:predicted alpha-1,6-mannanase (GH76 family)